MPSKSLNKICVFVSTGWVSILILNYLINYLLRYNSSFKNDYIYSESLTQQGTCKPRVAKSKHATLLYVRNNFSLIDCRCYYRWWLNVPKTDSNCTLWNNALMIKKQYIRFQHTWIDSTEWILPCQFKNQQSKW